jgi:DNA-directed RNA polymerase specialized sigma24 family protein
LISLVPWRQGLQVPDAEDVIQEVFLTLAARVTDFRREREG